MCEFFSFQSFEGKFYYFRPEDIKAVIKKEGLDTLYNFNSHDSIAVHFKLDIDKCNKYEYNPFSQEFKTDQINAKPDDRKEAEKWVKELFDFKDKKDFLKFCRNYYKKVDYKKLSKDLGNIPTKKDVIKLIKKIEKIGWFVPQEPEKDKINLMVKGILKAFKYEVGFEVQYNKLEKKQDWASAWDSAWDSAWASARASARASSAWDSARASSARDSARDSAWASAWASARDSAWASAWDSSAWDSAWASARASEFEVVKDIMMKKGYSKNPFRELLRLWEMGLYPVGVLKDKKFHIYYIPLKKGAKEC